MESSAHSSPASQPPAELDYNGATLRQDFIEIVSDRINYVKGKVYNFKSSEEVLFKLDANPTKWQPGNGMISFKDGGGWSAPKWNYLLKQALVDDFPAVYKGFLASQTCPESTDPQFQAFVLLQFEVARRMDGEWPTIPKRDDVMSAIDMALKVNEAGCYSHLVNMFQGNWRRQAFKQIKNYKDPNKAGLMSMNALGQCFPNFFSRVSS